MERLDKESSEVDLDTQFENQDEDIVRALWRHGEYHEQGSRTGRCGWITSFLRSNLTASLVEATDKYAGDGTTGTLFSSEGTSCLKAPPGAFLLPGTWVAPPSWLHVRDTFAFRGKGGIESKPASSLARIHRRTSEVRAPIDVTNAP